MSLEQASSLLSRLGLKGGVQVHESPVVLQPDQRAHQVFLNFASPEPIKAVTGPLYFAGTPVHILAGVGRQDCRLDGEWPWPTGASAVIPAVREDHPGGFYGLVWVMDRLLGPGGCPWDQEQTHHTLKRHLIEECYELVEAIDSEQMEAMVEELGDVMLQPVFHAQMEARDGAWTIEAPIKAITDKLFRRHPHVFGNAVAEDSEAVLDNWNKIKKQEKKGNQDESILAGVPSSLPSLLRAFEVSKRAVRAGFEWPSMDAVWDKVREEEAELQEAWSTGQPERIEAELGDLLFSIVNLARWMKVDPEEALRRMVSRFILRFRHMESSASAPLESLTPEEWDRLWNEAKKIHSGP